MADELDPTEYVDRQSFMSPSSMKKFTVIHSKQASRIIEKDNSISVSKIEDDY